MAVIEARAAQQGCISIVYAQPIGGKREFRFNFGHEVAQHVEQNRSDLFNGQPLDAEKREAWYDNQKARGFRFSE